MLYYSRYKLFEDLRKDIIDIDKIVLYKPVLLKDLKNKIDLLLSQQEVTG